MMQPSQYPIEVYYSEEDGGFIALARDLPGCSAFGKTQAKAVGEIQHAIKAWQSAAVAAKNPIPEPSRLPQEQLPSGRVLLRLPRSLHASLIESAKSEGVSLNQHMVSLLSAGATVKQVFQRFSRAVSFAPPSFGVVRAQNVNFTRLEIIREDAEKVVQHGTFDLRRLPANQPVVQSK
jgi:antitoxin HicB